MTTMTATADSPTRSNRGGRVWPEATDLHMVGVDVRTVDREELGRLSLHGGAATSLLDVTARRSPDTELAVLSTCNRVEFYLAGPAGLGIDGWLPVLMEEAPAWSEPVVAAALAREGAAVATHLLRVACGLESDILGDPQVVAQIRGARSAADAHGTLGRTLDRLFSMAVKVSRRARSATAIAAEDVGIGSIVAEAILDHGGPLARKSPAVCVLGSGAAAEAVVEALADRGVRRVEVVARNDRAARAMVGRRGGEARQWSALEECLGNADAIVAATSASRPLVTSDLILDLFARRGRAVPLLIDLGHRPNIARTPSAPVLDLARLTGHDGSVSPERMAAVPEVERLIAAEVDDWKRRRCLDRAAPLPRLVAASPRATCPTVRTREDDDARCFS